MSLEDTASYEAIDTFVAEKEIMIVKAHRYSFSWLDKITTIELIPNLKKMFFIISNFVVYS